MRLNIYNWFFLLLFISVTTNITRAQSLDIPSSNFGISFGNSKNFSGLRFNFIDKNIKHINGINVSIWQPNDEDETTGSINGIGIGLPMAYGSSVRNGIGLGVFAVGAKSRLAGINIGGLAVGAGDHLTGINIGGLAAGAGQHTKGITLGGLAAGAGKNLSGISIGGLAAGAGENSYGITIAGLAAGAGKNAHGINIAGLAAGAGDDVKGLNIAGLVVGAGHNMAGINIGGLAVGAGNRISGINISGLVVGAPKVEGLSIAPMVGGNELTGFSIGAVYLTVRPDEDHESGFMKGVSISAFNHIKAEQRGLSIGILNIAHHLKGLQIGLINIARSNRKGLKVLPVFNAPFH